jgi:hypothetical protein
MDSATTLSSDFFQGYLVDWKSMCHIVKTHLAKGVEQCLFSFEVIGMGDEQGDDAIIIFDITEGGIPPTTDELIIPHALYQRLACMEFT